MQLPLRILFFLLLSFFLGSATSQAQVKWEFKNEKDNVRVYYKKHAGVHEVKLITTFETNVAAIVKLFADVPLYADWGYKVSSAKLLKKNSETDIYYHSTLDFPWPMNDRDVIMRSRISQDSTSGVVTSVSEAKPTYLPLVQDVVRMEVVNTRWILRPQANGTVEAEYYIYSHPGGNIPDWLVNMAIDVGPRETIKGMRKYLKLPNYQGVRLAHIKE